MDVISFHFDLIQQILLFITTIKSYILLNELFLKSCFLYSDILIFFGLKLNPVQNFFLSPDQTGEGLGFGRLLKIFCRGIKLRHYYLYCDYVTISLWCSRECEALSYVTFIPHIMNNKTDLSLTPHKLQPSRLMKEAATLRVYRLLIVADVSAHI